MGSCRVHGSVRPLMRLSKHISETDGSSSRMSVTQVHRRFAQLQLRLSLHSYPPCLNPSFQGELCAIHTQQLSARFCGVFRYGKKSWANLGFVPFLQQIRPPDCWFRWFVYPSVFFPLLGLATFRMKWDAYHSAYAIAVLFLSPNIC